MINEYNPEQIEHQVQEFWQEKKSFCVSEDLSKEKFYCLSMFPYPSGALHMGHVRNYTLGDVVSRLQRMLGKNVLQPIGWDAFGLPAENAAIKHKIHPAKWTYQNIDHMRTQLKRLGFAYDWKREITTCSPDYYRWEQWLFIKLFEKGLAYKKNAVVNWDPVDQTVLANEQVVDGRGWRSGALVERREISQWFIKITAYADELLAELENLTEWPEQVRTMQANWIGRSEGVVIYFDVAEQADRIKIFTTRPDTLFGCTYVAVALEHPLAKQAAASDPTIAAFIKECGHVKVAEADMATMEKRGIATPFHAKHPLTGELVPIWIANFVLMEYGSGAVMCVPAHDQRDWEFAKKYQLPMKQVIASTTKQVVDLNQSAFTEHGTLINSDKFDRLTFAQAFDQISQLLTQKQLGKRKTHYRLRDWGVSRQRYWGTPIPMIECPTCGPVPVREEDLPIVLPENIELDGTGNPLKSLPSFYRTTCPRCDHDAIRETDTFDTFIESSWYYARYSCVNQDKAMLDDRAKYWTPVDFYIGGIEHAVMHLLYARFFHKLLRDNDLVNSDEPFKRLLTQGMVLKDGSKMSKSKGNTVDPQTLIQQYGADTVRFFIIFASPAEQALEWSDSGVEGAYRFLRRVYSVAQDYKAIGEINLAHSNNLLVNPDWSTASEKQTDLRRDIYETLRKILFDYERMQFNTVCSGAMKLLNALTNIDKNSNDILDHHLMHEGFSILLRVLSPITPHITQYLWQELHYGKAIIDEPLPKLIKEALKSDSVEFVVQVNGKLRGQIKVPHHESEDAILKIALADPVVARFLENKTLAKTIVVMPRRLVNLVIRET